MAQARRSVVVGKLVAHGEKFRFEPHADLRVEGRAGEEVEFALAYNFEEATPRKEALRLCLIVRLDGTEDRAGERWIHDRPGVHDHVAGTLPVVAALPKQGEARGTFLVEAVYRDEPWSGKPKGAEDIVVADFRRAGRFTVRVA